MADREPRQRGATIDHRGRAEAAVVHADRLLQLLVLQLSSGRAHEAADTVQHLAETLARAKAHLDEL